MAKRDLRPQTTTGYEQRWADDLAAFGALVQRNGDPEVLRQGIRVLQKWSRQFQQHADALSHFLPDKEGK